MKEKILELLTQIRPENDFESSENYLADGLLDSLDIIELISEIESKLNIELDVMEIVPENFVNLETITKFVEEQSSKGV